MNNEGKDTRTIQYPVNVEVNKEGKETSGVTS